MPIYEYRAIKDGCSYCRRGFDTLQRMSDKPLSACPKCGAKVRRSVSRFSANVTESPEEAASLEEQIQGYEAEGKWGHAAELADKAGLQERALNDYKKAGYNF